MASLTPYLWGLATFLLLGWTLASLQPLSPLRPFMVSLILASGAMTTLTAPSASTNSSWNCFIGMYSGVLLSLEAIDHVCLSRLHYDSKKSSEDGNAGLLTVIRWTADSISNKRKIGTPRQVRNVPHFDSRRPDYVPTRVHFLLFRSTRFMLTYLLLDLLTSTPAQDLQEIFNKRKEPLLGRVAAGQITVEEFVERLILTGIFSFMSYAVQTGLYDLFSIIAVGSLLSNPADWPPRFGSISDAYTIRRFWGTFWHQELQQSLTSNSSAIVHQILRIPKKSLFGRYANLLCAFVLSGLIHVQNDRFMQVPIAESSAVYFFSVQALGIMVEDAVQYVFGMFAEKGSAGSRHDRPSLWLRVLGFAWVAFFLSWQTPFWSYPLLRPGSPLPLPVRFFKALS